MFYLDTSAAIAAHTPEVATLSVQDWLRGTGPGELAVSRWVMTEFSSGLALKLRTGALTIDQRARVLADWKDFLIQEACVLEVEPAAFDRAGAMVERQDLALRASDALHLAIASAAGCTLVTLDARMARAAPELGVPVAAM